MNMARKVFNLLTSAQRKKTYVLLFLILVMAFLDVIGVASIIPFITVLSEPDTVYSNKVLFKIYQFLDFQNEQSFLFFLGVLVFATLVISLSFKAFTTYMQLRFIFILEYSLGKRLLRRYLNQPYVWFKSRHSADLSKTLLSELSQVVHGAFLPLLTVIAQSTVVFALLILLLIVDVQLALTTGAIFICAYGLIFRAVSGFLERIGRERVDANEQRFTAVT